MADDDIEEIPTLDDDPNNPSNINLTTNVVKNENGENLSQSLQKHRMRWKKVVNKIFLFVRLISLLSCRKNIKVQNLSK